MNGCNVYILNDEIILRHNNNNKKTSWTRNGASLVVKARLHIHLLNYHEKNVNDFVVIHEVGWTCEEKEVFVLGMQALKVRERIIFLLRALEILKRYNLQWTHLTRVKRARRSRKLRYKNFTTQPTTWTWAGKPSRTF